MSPHIATDADPATEIPAPSKKPTSQARIDANRRNALKSTGPKTEEGKEKSRRNSMIHGLSGGKIVLPEAAREAVDERMAHIESSIKPFNAFEFELLETIAVEMLRIERCRAEERVNRAIKAKIAVDCWEDERRAQAAHAGRALGRKPVETVWKLGQSAPGCDWMIGRWRALGYEIDAGWTDERASMALDLLGIDPGSRSGPMPIDAPENADVKAHRRALVADQIARLEARKQSSLDEAEADRREAALLGLHSEDDPSLVLLRRYETASHRRLNWALNLIRKANHRAGTNPDRKWDDPNEPAWKSSVFDRNVYPQPVKMPTYSQTPPPGWVDPDTPERSQGEDERSQSMMPGYFSKAYEPAMTEPESAGMSSFSTLEEALTAISPASREDRQARERRRAAMAPLGGV